MSIVEALMDAVERACVDAMRRERRSHADAGVVAVRVRVGKLRQVEPETLRFCYNASVRDTHLAGSQLEIEVVPATARCRACRAEFPVEDNWFECPCCRSVGAELLTGQELDLTSIELEEQHCT
ncbi:MAG: hydrogenase maturation nickel metallochaperone HypA [Verrucomicrobiia bacterium]|jgi:hydrogenase nickel incorporation protein HypA/HybF